MTFSCSGVRPFGVSHFVVGFDDNRSLTMSCIN